MFGLEGIFVAPCALHAHPHVGKQTDEVVHVEDVGYVFDVHFFGGEQRGADHL